MLEFAKRVPKPKLRARPKDEDLNSNVAPKRVGGGVTAELTLCVRR